MRKFSALLLLACIAFAAAHDGEDDDHNGSGDSGSKDDFSGSSGRGDENHGDGYRGFAQGKVLGNFQVTSGLNTFNYNENGRDFSLSVLIEGDATSNLTVSAVTGLGDFSEQLGRFGRVEGNLGFSLAYNFSFSGQVQVLSANLSVELSAVQLLVLEPYLPRLGLYFVSAANRYFGQVQTSLTRTNDTGTLSFSLLPTTSAVYFFAFTANTSDAVNVLFDTKRNHGANEKVKLNFDAGLSLEFVNRKSGSSWVSFRNSDNNTLPANFTAVGRFFDVEVTDQDGLNATLTFTFNATALAARGFKLNKLRWAVLANNGTWVVQGGVVTGNVVITTTTHFSSWAVLADNSADSSTQVSAKSASPSLAPVALFALVACIAALVL